MWKCENITIPPNSEKVLTNNQAPIKPQQQPPPSASSVTSSLWYFISDNWSPPFTHQLDWKTLVLQAKRHLWTSGSRQSAKLIWLKFSLWLTLATFDIWLREPRMLGPLLPKCILICRSFVKYPPATVCLATLKLGSKQNSPERGN